MGSSIRSWILLPVLVVTMALVVAACETDDDADDTTTDTDDTEQVEDTDDETTDDAAVEDEDDAVAEDEDDAAAEDEDDAASEDEDDATVEDEDDGAAEDDAADVEAGDYPDVNDALGGPIMFGDFDWESSQVHNRIMQFVFEHGYGHETDEVFGSTLPILQGLEDGDAHVVSELWTQNMPEWYFDAVEDGTYIDLGNNYDGAVQGWFVPTYMIEGDEERDIEPITPDLQHIDDLPELWEVFEDEEDSSMGRFYNGIHGWEVTQNNEVRLEGYGLTENYNSFIPGSEAALLTSLVTAYDAGEPWIGYLWTPLWIFVDYDMTQIEEPEHQDACYQEVLDAVADGGTADDPCAMPEVDVNVVINPEFDEAAPHLVEFLENYQTDLEQTDAILLYITDEDASVEEAAEWWLSEYEDIWTDWVPEDVAQGVLDALN